MLRVKTPLLEKQTDNPWISSQRPVIPPSGAAQVTKLQTPTREVPLHHPRFPSALPPEHPGQLSWSPAPSMLLGAAANRSLCPAPFVGQGSREQQAKLPSTEQDTGHAKEGKGWQRAHPVRRRYASLNSVLAEKLQPQRFRRAGTPGNRRGRSLPGAEVQTALSDWDRKRWWIDTQRPRSSHR